MKTILVAALFSLASAGALAGVAASTPASGGLSFRLEGGTDVTALPADTPVPVERVGLPIATTPPGGGVEFRRPHAIARIATAAAPLPRRAQAPRATLPASGGLVFVLQG